VLFLFSGTNAEEVTKTVKVELFYPRDGTENGTSEPNWYYFWKSPVAAIEIPRRGMKYRGRANLYGEFDYPRHYSQPNNYTYGPSPTGGTDKLYIDLLARGTNNTTGHGYIDCFGETLTHENSHIQHWDDWVLQNKLDYDHDWKPDELETNEDIDKDGKLDNILGGEPYQDYGLDGQPNTGDFGEGNGVYDTGELFTDIDGDSHWDRNNYENDGNPPTGQLPFDNADGILNAAGTFAHLVDSDRDGLDDEEELAYDAEHSWPNNLLDFLDWASPGSNSGP